MQNNTDLVKCKKKLSEGINKSEFNHLDDQDLEVILFEGISEEAKKFILKSDIKARKHFEENKTLNFIGKIMWSKRNSNEVLINGAHSNIDFKISRHLKDKYDDFITQGKGLGRITIRKHKENFYFIEKFEPFKYLREKSFKMILDIRDKYSDDEWKNLLLGTLGYDLRDSEGITRDLLLVRLLPYVEKNYNYIELGGKSTGKTTIAEKFNTGEKINANISASNFIYNTQKKEYGILFSKDVLYLDEVNFTSVNKEIAPSLLQAKAGNKIEVRGIYNARRTDASFVSQGNIENAEYQFISKTLLKDFEGGFNTDAHFDRECFLIAGWLIPSYSKITLKDDTEGIRMDLFEDYLKVLREKSEYSYLIPDIYTNLVGNSSSGRFDEQVKKSISGFLKLVYPNKNFELEENKKSIDSIIALSCFGKYLIQECASDLGNSEYKNDYLEFSYADKERRKITRKTLEDFYVKAKEYKYFVEDGFNLESEEIEYPWKVENYEIEGLKENLDYMIERVFIPKNIEEAIEEVFIDKKYEIKELYRVLIAYKNCNKTLEEVRRYTKVFRELTHYFKMCIDNSDSYINKIYNNAVIIFQELNNNAPTQDEIMKSSELYNTPLASSDHSYDGVRLLSSTEEVLLEKQEEVKKNQNEYREKTRN